MMDRIGFIFGIVGVVLSAYNHDFIAMGWALAYISSQIRHILNDKDLTKQS